MRAPSEPSIGPRWLVIAGLVLLLGGLLFSADRLASWTGHDGPFGIANQRSMLALRVVSAALGVALILFRKNSWLTRLARQMAFFVLLWALVESMCWTYMRLFFPVPKETGTPALFVHGPPQGFRLRPYAREICTRTLDGDTVYSVTCTINNDGGRATPSPTRPTERTVVFLGCSFTFGTGVRDEETLPALYAEMDTTATVLNRAVPGYGPQNWWLQFREKELAPLIHTDSVLFILPVIDGHVARAVGSMQVYSTWGENLPYCRLENGHIMQHGTFTTDRPWTSTFYWMLYKSPVVRYSGMDIPPPPSRQGMELMMALLEDAARMAREQYPRSRFLVVLHPGMTTSPYFMEHLDRELLDVCDLSTVTSLDVPRIRNDPHPSGVGHAHVARFIVNHLKRHEQTIVHVEGR